MDKLTLIIFIGLSLFILYIFFYIIKRDKIIEQKFAALEMSLEEVHKEIYLLKKRVNEDNTLKSLEQIERIIETIVDDIRFMEEKNKEFYKKVEEEISKIENNYKKTAINSLNNINKHEESKILSLYKNGYSIEEISRTLRIPAGEIELILKFANLN